MKPLFGVYIFALVLLINGCDKQESEITPPFIPEHSQTQTMETDDDLREKDIIEGMPTAEITPEPPLTFYDKLALAAIERTMHQVRYDPKYVQIPYPMGDVAPDTGVCTDVVIRSYREFGIDLQELVHEDMQDNFKRYPSREKWGLKRPDANIDHRRVYNLQTYFERFGESLPISDQAKNYLPGDLVTWQITPSMPHIGIVVDVATDNPDRKMIVHNIGEGPKIDDILFAFPITGHYRFNPIASDAKTNDSDA
jgi:uncharacterized protein YijF (DUF1287 family)